MSIRCEGQERRGLRNIWEKWRNPDRIHISALMYMAIVGNMGERCSHLDLNWLGWPCIDKKNGPGRPIF